jgi:hydrogenase maturation protease
MTGIKMKTVVVGIGNPILRDDGVGIHVANELKKHIDDNDVVFDEAYTGGMNLLDIIVGYERAILIDAVNLSNAKPGDIKRLTIDDLSCCHTCNPHDVSLREALELAKKLGEHKIPKEIVVIGIVVKDNQCEFGEELSAKMKKSVPKAVAMALDELQKINT